MTKKPMSKSESKSNAAQAQSMPMPTRMPVRGAASTTNPQMPPTNESTRVGPMVDYPNGRGGMRVIPMLPAEQSAQLAPHPSSPIGDKPPAVKMPANS